ncbi:MAG: ParB N-terminal domain-containing protein [Alphaproteobacteria bacterium]|nr:ParB N-terminal domain-containing protein [Alphaproteobacteria bacterium]
MFDLGTILRDTSKQSNNDVNTIKELPIADLVPNPENFYGMREIDELARMMTWTKDITPLTVKPIEDGKYMIIKGHRRFLAAQKAIAEGYINRTTLPCKIRTYSDITFTGADGNNLTITAADLELMNLVLDNKGQHSKMTVAEMEKEYYVLYPLAEKIFESLPKEERKEKWQGSKQLFFAQEIIGISYTQFRRREMLRKLEPKVKQAIDDGDLTMSYGVELAIFDPEEQLQRLEEIINGERVANIKEIQEEKRQRAAEKRKNSHYEQIGSELLGDKQDEPDTETEDESDFFDLPEKKIGLAIRFGWQQRRKFVIRIGWQNQNRIQR